MEMIKIHTRKGIIPVREKKIITSDESPKCISSCIHITTFQICTGHFFFLEASLTSELISLPRWSLYLIPGIDPSMMINKVEIVEYL